MALPRQGTDRKPHPTNWIALGPLQTHLTSKMGLHVISQRAVYPAEHKT